MKISLRLAELLGADALRRGIVTEIEEQCHVERHTVTSWLHNTARYVNLDALGRVADYLAQHGVDRNILPGALLGRDPEYFWDALADCKHLHFCLGTRRSPEWSGSDYVMSSDARLQSQMLMEISNRVYRTNGGMDPEAGHHFRGPSPQHTGESAVPQQGADAAPHGKEGGQPKQTLEGRGTDLGMGHSLFPNFHLLPGPAHDMTAAEPGEGWGKSKADAVDAYNEFFSESKSALIALGSIKANPLVEVILAKAFSAEPFVSEDHVAKPRDRKCPILFRYREKDDVFGRDPQPPACCGGTRLAARTPAPLSGMYYETPAGDWEGCPWNDNSDDVAFLFYSYRPNNVQVEVACGGFSARATRCFTRKLAEIGGELGPPQYMTPSLHVGLYLVKFSFNPKDKNHTRDRDDRDCKFRVIALDEKVLRDRLAGKRTTHGRAAAPVKKTHRKR